jgi:hypothetical protein
MASSGASKDAMYRTAATTQAFHRILPQIRPTLWAYRLQGQEGSLNHFSQPVTCLFSCAQHYSLAEVTLLKALLRVE